MSETTETGTILDRIVAGKREELERRNGLGSHRVVELVSRLKIDGVTGV